MRRGFVAGIVLVIAASGGVGCNVLIGVDEPIFRGAGGAGGTGGAEGGMGGLGGMAGAGGCAKVESVCDGKDDDCNGQVDDLPLVTCGFGVCQRSVPGCTDGKPSECLPGDPTQGELCDNDNDGLDDDCDGLIDEGCPCKQGEMQPCYTGTAETRNIGICKDGSQTCIADNMWGPCTGDTLPALEECNGLDDDCDANVDQGFAEITCGIGACQNTISSCNPLGPPVCMPKEPLPDELCNGQDDDCDGQTDENNPGGGGVCMTGMSGPCANGFAICQGGGLGCLPTVMPTMETCNNVDDDCDGQIDNGVPSGADCMTGLMGECGKGKTTCLNGAYACIGPAPVDETCNGLDDDCDGEIDTHGVDAGLDCDTMIPGVCAAGLTVCVNAKLQCNQKNTPSTDVCDNKDNNCDGTVDEGDPGGGGACVFPGQKGVCADAILHCQNGIITCVQQNFVKAETCNGLDDDCDGDVDEGIVCGSCGSTVLPTASCASIGLPATVTLVEGCKQVFPPSASIPITIATPGTVYYVSPTGNDFSDGKTVGTAWKTLCHAIAAAPPGNTVKVAQGAYLSTSLVLAKGLTVVGGYNTTFTQWIPETYPTIFYGRLTMDHNNAVWGGFRMIGNPINTSQVQHAVKAGTFVRNYVEAVFGGSALVSAGMDVTACGAGQVLLQANDMYIGSTVSTTHKGIQLGFQQGTTKLDGNRICVEGKAAATNYALFGYGPNAVSTPRLTVVNNILESAKAETALVRFEGQNGGTDYNLVFTNNTLLALSTGLSGTAAASGKMRYRFTNNILFTMGGGSTAENLGSGAGVSVDSVENNLVFGFSNNLLAQPAPVLQAGNDTSGSATATSVFVNAASGDFHIKTTPGQADETGKNVNNNVTYGAVTLDITLAPRPAAGNWDRGAYKN